jgi:SAM-dependent methyltransferase
MSESVVSARALDPADVNGVIQAVRFELYRENIYGALEIVEAAHSARPDPRYAEQAARIRSWLGHLQSREAYVDAQERQYKGLRWKAGLKLLEKRIRMLSGKKTRKMIERRGRDPEFQALEHEVDAVEPRRVLDAGSGEGGVAMALCARHPELAVDGVEVSFTNVRIARQLNRWKTATFRQGLAEEVHEYFEPGRFDLAYSFAVLEHVRDVDATVHSILTVLRSGGRFCFVVPMHELRACGPIPDYRPVHGYADHCRVFSEADLRRRWGGEPGFRLVKIPGAWKHGEIPDCFEPVEFGSFFVSFAKA